MKGGSAGVRKGEEFSAGDRNWSDFFRGIMTLRIFCLRLSSQKYEKKRMKWSQVDLLRLLCGGRSLSPFLVKEFLHIDTGCGDVEKIFTVAKYREQK